MPEHSHAAHSHAHVDTPPSADAVARAVLRAEKVCDARGRRFTDLRKHVYELILSDGGAVKAYDLLDRLKPEKGSPKPPTVYRALDFLSDLGLIHRVEALNAYIACDPLDCADGHPGHVAEFFICDCCQSVQERHTETDRVQAPSGFGVKRSVMEHYGTCALCAA